MTARTATFWRRAAAACLAVLLAACASPDFLRPGAQRGEVLRELGQPYFSSTLPGGGERMVYSTQPMGRQVYHLDFDAQGSLVHREQVLTFQNLAGIPAGTPVEEVRRFFGPPMRVEQVARFDGDIWTYRFLDDINTRRFAHVHIDRQGVVRKVMFTDEPDPREWRAF
ncbi:hypothetical protein [Paracidovorax cattleyae]|uniref:Beta-barrel assembly machine subunit BamE n=1 Tax=Paracidovorax cattleyae TaxID=80868 RepID=A0A1H0P667_9BURK|nr:hypothetical protein [Paracidovorax cattleyae]AVS76107.1 hypothetical protein C8240_20825 [Paracidovorax cattleyae]SDP00444.1 hypothetical protein SAMN04489708_1069 [Paracidovorax cattleyae]